MEDVLSGGVRREMRDGQSRRRRLRYGMRLLRKRSMNCTGTAMSTVPEPCCSLPGRAVRVTYEPQTLNAAVGLHGAGGYRAQCGLVRQSHVCRSLFKWAWLGGGAIVSACYRFAEAFSGEFGSLTCSICVRADFSPDDPPHRCEALTCRAVEFTYKFMKALLDRNTILELGADTKSKGKDSFTGICYSGALLLFLPRHI